MSRTVVIVGTLDTKGGEIDYLRRVIEGKGLKATVVDVGMGGEPSAQADITCAEIARLGGAEISAVRAAQREEATQIMIAGATRKLAELYSAGKLDGLISIGGASATYIGTRIMKSLPFGVPKLMVSSVIAMPGFATNYIGTQDIMVLNSVVDIVGLNEMVESVLERAGNAICGMAETAPAVTMRSNKPLVAVSTFGFSDNCGKYAVQLLEEKGYQPIVFHAQGIGDRAMEEFIAQGFFDGVVDIVLAGVSEHLTEGYRDAGPERLEAAGKRGIPQVVTPCGLNYTGCGGPRKHGEKYRSREKVLLIEGGLRGAARYYPEELLPIARAIAEKLNRARGPVKFVAPRRGWCSIEREGQPVWDLEGNALFLAELRKQLKPEIEIIEVDSHLEDPSFARVLIEAFDHLMRQRRPQ